MLILRRVPASPTSFRSSTETRPLLALWFSALFVLMHVVTPAAAACGGRTAALGVKRVQEIDTSMGPVYGSITKLAYQPSFLAAGEVTLTFDDGPHPARTRAILDILDRYCTKATFFILGQRALLYPDIVREIIDRGHTVATHTMTHPYRLARMAPEKAELEIERGFAAAVAAAAGKPVAPFFRFPGLADSGALVAYLATRGIGTFTVDIVSNDSYIASASRLAERTLKQLDHRGGGILLFHDIKLSTVKALPVILEGLKARKLGIVHMTPAAPVEALPEIVQEMTGKLTHVKPSPHHGVSGDEAPAGSGPETPGLPSSDHPLPPFGEGLIYE